jgi:hypothetical protein
MLRPVRAQQLELPISSSSPRDGATDGARSRRSAAPDAAPRGADEEVSPEAPPIELPDEHPFELELPPPSARTVRRAPLPPRPLLEQRAATIARSISAQLDRPVRLFVTDNRSTMLSFRRVRDLLILRLHHMFLEAPDEVLRAVADYSGRGARSAGAVIDAYVREHSGDIRVGESGRAGPRLCARGREYDLQAIFERLNGRFFDGAIDARIGWGRAGPGRRRRTIRMGVYDHLTRTIRIHPSLDRPEVPLFFVEYIVFHEMLHQAVPGRDAGSRKQHHGPEFRARERRYPDYARALAWEKANLNLLLGRGAIFRVRPVD